MENKFLLLTLCPSSSVYPSFPRNFTINIVFISKMKPSSSLQMLLADIMVAFLTKSWYCILTYKNPLRIFNYFISFCNKQTPFAKKILNFEINHYNCSFFPLITSSPLESQHKPEASESRRRRICDLQLFHPGPPRALCDVGQEPGPRRGQ